MGSPDKHQIHKNRTYFESFYHAFVGIYDLITNERNFRFHIKISLFVVAFGILCKINLFDWLWIFLCIFTVIGSEIVNTLFEELCNLMVGNHYNQSVKKIKDIAAANVLLASLFSIIIGCFIFIPIIVKFISSWR